MKKLIGMMLVLAFVASVSQGAALTAARDTPSRSGSLVNLTVASNVIIYAGSLVCVNSSGKAVPAADTSGYSVVGRASKTVDNRTAVYSASAAINVERGVFRWATNDVIVAADIGKLVYVTDDQTVNITGGGQNIIAGTIVDVETGVGAWIDTAKIGPSGAASPSSLAVAGAATVGTTLTVAGNSTFNGTTATVTNNLVVSKAATVGTTLGVTGIATFTATPALNAARGTAGSVLLAIHNAPAGTTTNALWVPVTVGGTNCWVAAYPQ